MNKISLWQQGVDAYRAGKGIHEAPPSRFDRFFDGQRQSWLNGWKWARDNVSTAQSTTRNHAVTAASIDLVRQAFKHPANIPPAADYALMQGLAVTEEWCRGWNALRMYLIHPPVSNSND